MGKPARKTAFPFIPKPGHCNTSTCSFNEENAECYATAIMSRRPQRICHVQQSDFVIGVDTAKMSPLPH